MEKFYGDDVDIEMLAPQMEILKVLLRVGYFLCFDDIVVKIKELLAPERKMVNEVITVCKLILVTGNQCSSWKIVFDCPEIKSKGSFNNDPRTI